MFYQPNWPDVAKACKSVSEKKILKKSFAIHNITSKQKKVVCKKVGMSSPILIGFSKFA